MIRIQRHRVIGDTGYDCHDRMPVLPLHFQLLAQPRLDILRPFFTVNGQHEFIPVWSEAVLRLYLYCL